MQVFLRFFLRNQKKCSNFALVAFFLPFFCNYPKKVVPLRQIYKSVIYYGKHQYSRYWI